MRRHIIDHPRSLEDSARAARFIKLDRSLRSNGPRHITNAMRRQKRSEAPSRLSAYLRMERGYSV